MVSVGSTSSVIVFPVSVLTKICILLSLLKKEKNFFYFSFSFFSLIIGIHFLAEFFEMLAEKRFVLSILILELQHHNPLYIFQKR